MIKHRLIISYLRAIIYEMIRTVLGATIKLFVKNELSSCDLLLRMCYCVIGGCYTVVIQPLVLTARSHGLL